MNVEMWDNPATQRNVAQLRADGICLFGPGRGAQACGETGMGRMLEADELVDELIASFQHKVLAGQRVLITAGPTFEPIDPVRGITNLSSGKMGYAIARAAREAGADVTLVSGPTSLPTPHGVRRIDVLTAQQMHDAVMAGVDGPARVHRRGRRGRLARRQCQRPENQEDADGAPPALEFAQNADILASVAATTSLSGWPYCVGFAAESENLIELRRRQAREERHSPAGRQYRAADLRPGRQHDHPVRRTRPHRAARRADKLTLARQLVSEIAKRLEQRSLLT